MPTNITDELHAATTKGKIASAKEVFLTGDTENLQQIGEKTHQLEDSIKNIAATGGASTAAAVTFDNVASGMTAVNAQGAIEELNSKNKSQDTEISKKANSVDVASQIQTEQKRVNTELGKKANTADVNTKISEEKERVNGELNKKLVKTDIVQELGEDNDKVLSQKIVSETIVNLSYNPSSVEHFLNKPSNRISYDGSIVSQTDMRVEFYKVKVGDIFNLTLSSNTGPTECMQYGMYSSDSLFDSSTLVKLGDRVSTAYNINVIIPSGVTVLAIQKAIGGRLVDIRKYIPIKNNVSRNSDLLLSKSIYLSYTSDGDIKLNQKYSNHSDIQYCIKRCGVNQLYQLHSFGFIANTDKSVSNLNPSTYINSNTDWIGPYIISSKDGATYGSGGFTGGWHGSNGDQTGQPTAKHISMSIYADNALLDGAFNGYVGEVRVVVTNQIMAGNTLDNPISGASGYYCIEEEVTYLFKNGRIYVAVKIKALHNFNVRTYYGMQAAGFYKDAVFVGDIITNGTKSSNKTHGVFVRDDKGNGLLMCLNPVGLGCFEYADTAKFCFVSGAKSYFSLIGGKLLQMQTGDMVYWSGWYKFCDTLDIEDITTSGSVNIVDDVVTGGNQSALSAEQGKVLSSAVSDIANKLVLIKRDATLPSQYSDWVVGDVYFNRSNKRLYRITSISPSDAKSFSPQTNGHYIYNNEICVWDEEKFVQKTSVINPNGVFVDSAVSYFLNTQDKIYSVVQKVIKSLKLYGLDPTRKYIVSKMSVVDYKGYFFSFKVADVTDGEIKNVCTFQKTISSTDTKDIVIKASNVTDKNLYNSKMLISLQYVRDYFSGFTIESVDSDTYNKYGLSPNCILSSEPIKLPVQGFKRISYAIRKISKYNLDTTRCYRLKAFSYDKDKNNVFLSICTDENFQTVYSNNVHVDNDVIGIKRIYTDGYGSYIDLDFDLINSSHYSSFSASTLEDTLDIDIDIADTRMKLIAGDEIELTFDGKPLRLLDCGKNSDCFYMSCGNSIYKTKHILNNNYTASDLGKSIELVYTFSSESVTGTTNFITGINGLRELSTGKLLINVKIDSHTTVDSENFKSWSQFYMYDGKTMKLLFDGCWRYHTFSDGTVRNGGAWYSIWDFHEVDNYIFLSERCDQGLGGRAWMSKDYGETWYVIFNAFGDDSRYASPGLYPVVQPSGFDTEHNDFNRPYLPNHSNGYFHIHGIAYDRWRKQVIIVSGDLTWEQGSYTAVWVLKNPDNCPLYPATDIDNTTFPEGGTWESNNVKMLKCNWTRVGLHKNDTGIKNGNMQFVGCIPYKDVLAFSTDCSGGGLNGVALNNFPSNIVSTNFKMSYPLNSDAEETLSHCGGGYLMLPNKPTLWVFHREGSGFNEQSSDQKAAILGSYNGKTWSRLWVDDTLDEKRISKISWGATMIGKDDEMYLRYKGFKQEQNIIRRMYFCY